MNLEEKRIDMTGKIADKLLELNPEDYSVRKGFFSFSVPNQIARAHAVELVDYIEGFMEYKNDKTY